MKGRQRRILLAATGLSPQVVTETVYALAVEHNWVPTEIRLLATVEGGERARLSLLEEGRGWLKRLQQEYDLPAIHFDPRQIVVLQGPNGEGLVDIRSAEENAAAADGINEAVRMATADTDSEVHVSVAGGRKTMGFYLGYALSLYGREQDRLSHVLVEPPFESHPEFFYPSRRSRIIYTAPPDSRPLDTSQARVTLADIPFVRLRTMLDRRTLERKVGFRIAVETAQGGVRPHLELDLPQGLVVAGGVEVRLPPAELAFYAMFARLKRRGCTEVSCPSEGPEALLAEEYLKEYELVAGGQRGERTKKALRNGMDRDFFLQRRARLDAALRAALGARAADYVVQKSGRRPVTRYRLGMNKQAIVFSRSEGGER